MDPLATSDRQVKETIYRNSRESLEDLERPDRMEQIKEQWSRRRKRRGTTAAISRKLLQGSKTIGGQIPLNYEVGFPLQNDVVDKVGKTSGWSTGSVSQTCTTIPQSSVTFLCQNVVDAAARPGDSGAAVFYYDAATGNADFVGQMWGGDIQNFQYFYFYSINNIQSQLGNMKMTFFHP